MPRGLLSTGEYFFPDLLFEHLRKKFFLSGIFFLLVKVCTVLLQRYACIPFSIAKYCKLHNISIIFILHLGTASLLAPFFPYYPAFLATGTSARAWRRASSPRRARTSPPWRRTMRRSDWTPTPETREREPETSTRGSSNRSTAEPEKRKGKKDED